MLNLVSEKDPSFNSANKNLTSFGTLLLYLTIQTISFASSFIFASYFQVILFVLYEWGKLLWLEHNSHYHIMSSIVMMSSMAGGSNNIRKYPGAHHTNSFLYLLKIGLSVAFILLSYTYQEVIFTKFCLCHYSCAVMACVHFCCENWYTIESSLL